MKEHILDMTLTAADALKEWDEVQSAARSSHAKKTAYFARYTALRQQEQHPGAKPVAPVKYMEGSSAPERPPAAEPPRKAAPKPPASVPGELPPSKPPSMKPKIQPIQSTRYSPDQQKTIIARVEQALAALGYTAYGGSKEACRLAGIGSTAIANMRAGNGCGPLMVQKLCAGLGISSAWVENGTGAMLIQGGIPFECKASDAKKRRPAPIPPPPPVPIAPSRRDPAPSRELGLTALADELAAAIDDFTRARDRVQALAAEISQRAC